MTLIALAPIVLNDAIVKIGTDTYEAALGEVRITPTSTPLVFRGIGKNSVKKLQTAPDWTITLGYAQDFATAKALALRLYTEHGAIVPVAVRLASGDTQEWKLDVVMAAGEVGGTADALLQSTVTLGVSGQPTRAAVSA